MLAASSLSYFAAKRVHIPHTVLLVIIGVLFVPLSLFDPFSFLTEFSLTPELLFYLFLPALIFESAFNMNIRRMVDDFPVISLLAVGSLLVSSFLIAGALTFVLHLLGFNIPFLVALIFGALISSTDPVAVLALFKEVGAPRRLSLIFEGESLFNDATSLALFLVILEIAIAGYHGVGSIFDGAIMFISMLLGGIVFGLIMGGIFAKLVGFARSNEFVSITLTIVLAHLTFILAELISHTNFFGASIHLSSIIATTIASMVMGNYGRSKISPRAEEFVEKFWGQFAFIVNSLIFILIGMLTVSLPASTPEFIIPILVTIGVVAAARAISVYPFVTLYNSFTEKARVVPGAWQHLLAWGSLRGALAVTMVLIIPPSLEFAGWDHPFSAQEFILAITVGCIFATLFIKATTITPMIRRLKVDALKDIEKLEYHEARTLIHGTVLQKLSQYASKGYISRSLFEDLHKSHTERHKKSYEACDITGLDALSYQVLRLYAIGVEKKHMKELLHYGEVDELTYKRVVSKLTIQQEHVEAGKPREEIHTYVDNKDVFEILAGYLRRWMHRPSLDETLRQQYMYYRALSIIARKVLKAISELKEEANGKAFSPQSLERTIELYTKFRENSTCKMEELEMQYPWLTRRLSEELAQKAAFKVEEQLLEELYEKEMITPKVYITLRDEFEHENGSFLALPPIPAVQDQASEGVQKGART
jgi:CPA1 family monovalent cation:H+ antiporter